MNVFGEFPESLFAQPQFLFRQRLAGDVAQVRGKNRRAVHLKNCDGQFDKNLGTIRSLRFDLDSAAEHAAPARFQITFQTRAMLVAQRRRHDQLGQFF
ncbi:MAG TPA: hypothetical protein VF751_11125, partial [Chthoniobacterales bacterium]